MSAAFFIPGEQKTRPGIYLRYENRGLPPIAGVDDGRCAATFSSNWGPLGRATAIENFAETARIYGDGGENDTTQIVMEQFRGGARLVFALRLGNGGTQGVYEILDTDDASIIRLVMLYPGSRPFLVTIRPTLEDPNQNEMLLIDGVSATTVLERFTFYTGLDDNGDPVNQAEELFNSITTQGSNFFTPVKLADSENPIAVIDQAAATPGTDPIINVAAYSDGFEVLEAHRWNVMSIDTNDLGVQMMMHLYLNRIYQGGKFTMGVIGQTRDTPFETRLRQASAYNDYQIIYVGTGFVDMAGTVYEGWLAAARIAGLVAGTPSVESVTRLPIRWAIDLTEPLTNFNYERAIRAGMFTFSVSSANTVWVESGINTLVLPRGNQDFGWQKIKRVKIRFELFQRIADTVDRIVARINNDPDGRMTVIQASNAVCNAMVAEGKLLAPAYVEEDPDNAPAGDSAWFIVYADDIDALEKIYYTFQFRFAPEQA